MNASVPRLGQVMLDQGWISPEVLGLALTEQLVQDQRLGSWLVAAQHITLEQLEQALSLQHGVRCATVDDFAQVDQDLIASTPGAVCDLFSAFPLRRRGALLELAMLDPHRLDQVDELAFVLGQRIEPLVAPELLLTYHLERRYGIRRPRRVRADVLERERELGREREREREPAPPSVEQRSVRTSAEPGSAGADTVLSTYQIDQQALMPQRDHLPRVVLRLVDLLARSIPLGEASLRVALPPKKGIATASKLVALGILLRR